MMLAEVKREVVERRLGVNEEISNEKVIPFKNNQILEQFERFYTKKQRKSTGTFLAYKGDIEEFFLIVKGTQFKFLKEDHLKITLDEFEDFIGKLEKKGLKNISINRKVQSVKSALSYLKLKFPFIETGFFEHIDKLDDDTRKYDALTTEEVLFMADLAKKERVKKDIKYYTILFALDTCVRKAAILNLKWSDFDLSEDKVIVSGIDKGNKKFKKEIASEFYEELLSIKTDSEYVFDISSDAINDMMIRLKKKMKLDSRNIVFHSIRKAGATFAFRMTGDILEAKKALGHSDINTTYRYLQERDYGSVGAVSMSKDLDVNIINEVSHEDLLKVLDECDQDIKILLARKLSKLQKTH